MSPLLFFQNKESNPKLSRDISVGIATSYEFNCWSSIPGSDKEFVSLLHSDQTGSGTHRAYYKLGTGIFCPGGKTGLGMKLAVTSVWCRRSTVVELYLHSPPHVFMARCLIKHMHNFSSIFVFNKNVSHKTRKEDTAWETGLEEWMVLNCISDKQSLSVMSALNWLW
jgi:hypothetical protein